MPANFSATLPSDVEHHLHQLDDENPLFADAMRMMLWDTYVEAGQPFGANEDGMYAWWAFGQGTTVQ
ncbi:MAG: hypothetical protein Rubg2KO_39840 [Rubricoccaceae bacterium]